jgi:hypothetical protein
MKTNVLYGGVFLMLAVAGGAPASAVAMPGILEDNLATASSQIRNFVPAGSRYRDSWVAIDYTPTAAVTVTAFRHHYLYNATPSKNQLNFQLIRGSDPGVGSLVATWSVPAAGWEEINAGWVMFGRSVYLCVVPFTPGRNLAAKRHYWFAYQSDNDQSPNDVYWGFWSSIKGDIMWYKLSGTEPWRDISGLAGWVDGTYRLDGGYTGVAPASIGKVKVLFR